MSNRDHKALLASAIARQAAGSTARAMMIANRVRRDLDSSDALAQRIRYFSSHAKTPLSHGKDQTDPFGAFFPQLRSGGGNRDKGESEVYHDGSTIGKPAAIDLALAESQSNDAGHGVSRNL